MSKNYTILGENSRTIGFVLSACSPEEAIERAEQGKLMLARGVAISENEILTARIYRPGVDRR